MTVTILREAPRSVRFELFRHDDRGAVDLGYDTRLWLLRQSPLGPTIGDDELAADKTLGRFGQAAARDYLDVPALAQQSGEARLLGLAADARRGPRLRPLIQSP